jgi:ABC-2 type transport system permease protein
MIGLTAAALITPTLFIPVVLLVADVRLFAPSSLWAVAGALELLLLMIISGRAFSGLVTRILRGRRGRDLAMLLVGSLGVAGFGLQQIIDHAVQRHGLAGALLSHPLSTAGRWLPPVAAQRAIAEAGSGNVGGTAVSIAVAAGWIVLIAAGWSVIIDRLTTLPEVTVTTAIRRNGHGLARLPGWSTPLLVARKELRFYFRDPRERMVWTGAVIFLGVIVASVVVGTATLSQLRLSPWLPLLGPLVVVFIGLPVALNQFGWERNAASFLFALPAKPSHMILGKNLATGSAILLEASVLSIILSAVSGRWSILPLIPPLALTAVACQLAIGNIVSVVAPLRLPNVGTDMFAQASEQGCLSIGAQVVSFFVIMLLLIPSVSAFALTAGFGQNLSPWIAAGGSLLWGATIYGIGLFISTKILSHRLPEIVSLVQTI